MRIIGRLRALSWLIKFGLVAVVLSSAYWGVIASDRFVSEAVIVVDRTDFHQEPITMNIAAILSGTGSTSGGPRDLALMREYLLSTDMLNKLDGKLDLRGHFSDRRHDIFSRMWGKNTSTELFRQYFLSRVAIVVDPMNNLMRIRAQAYTPEMARSIVVSFVEDGERFMNEMAHRLANEQVAFLEKQVTKLRGRVMKTRGALLSFQNTKGLMSPKAATETLNVMTSRLEAQISDLSARREALLGYLSPAASEPVQLALQIEALEKQLRVEQDKMAAPSGGTLNRTVEEYQRLEMEADFAREMYQSALVALEKGRVESVRTLKKVSVLESPTLPQYPLEPRRLYNTVVYALSVLVLTGIVLMLSAIIRDHKD